MLNRENNTGTLQNVHMLLSIGVIGKFLNLNFINKIEKVMHMEYSMTQYHVIPVLYHKMFPNFKSKNHIYCHQLFLLRISSESQVSKNGKIR